jgi:hypothetical protein
MVLQIADEKKNVVVVLLVLSKTKHFAMIEQ